MPRDLNGCLRPRPVRVAFLIEDGEHSLLALDGIFADCYGRWGGRFSLIVPIWDRTRRAMQTPCFLAASCSTSATS
jgi:hypothetical protein